MGGRPDPVVATIRMYKLECQSIYIDLRLSVRIPFYGRYYDDIGGLSTNTRTAKLMCGRLEQEDQDRLIKLTLDFPDRSHDYTPFLNVEVRVDEDGSFNTRLYRKPQKKQLTLNFNSHHPTIIKSETVKNIYQTAADVSSNQENRDYSTDLIDQLLLNNGYTDRVLTQITKKKEKTRKKKINNRQQSTPKATLKIPYLSEDCTAKIKRAADQCFLPIRIAVSPGQTLRDTLTSSRPLDHPKYSRVTCETCMCLEDGVCTTSNVVYQITCTMDGCSSKYIGETYRPLRDRFIEHLRSSKNPTARSYVNKPLAKHYNEQHPNCTTPKLSLKFLESARSTVNRKIKEARLIANLNPTINDRQELTELKQFLV